MVDGKDRPFAAGGGAASRRDRRIHPPTVTLPKGGGALRGIDEEFSVNAANGTASFSIPIPAPGGRAGFHPELALNYDSGGGNGPFGLGWSVPAPSIARKTDRGLPRYRDAEDSDVFLLSGTEDLVPSLVEANGVWTRDRALNAGFAIDRYRPRIESGFARIERWTDQTTGDAHWRTVSRDNVTSIYGRTTGARIADPADSAHVFRWFLEESSDDRGNIIAYSYKAENSDGVGEGLSFEHCRAAGGFTNVYLARVSYGNATPHQPGGWLFDVVFDFGDHDATVPTLEDTGSWPVRADPFSTFRAGFDVRTYRLCRRVLVFHSFPEIGRDATLVRSMSFTYDENPAATQLVSMVVTGHATYNGSPSTKSLPPVDFIYSVARVDTQVHDVDDDSIANVPAGLAAHAYQWADLDSEGLPGILAEYDSAWIYKRNLGGGRFGPTELVDTLPSMARTGPDAIQLLDLAGDGRKQLAQFGNGAPGYVERNETDGWGAFHPFDVLPNIDWDDRNLRHVDLDGDGVADLLITEHDTMRWYPSRGRAGFGPAEVVTKCDDEAKGPTLVFADETQSIFLADMTGDGLSDLVRVRNGEAAYWPNEGYGRFGPMIVMAAAPVFDSPELFSPGRLRFADIDGTGTTDVLYLGRDAVRYWINQSGNGWSEAREVLAFPDVDDLSSVAVLDLLGTGTGCLVWSSPLARDAARPMRYVDLTGGVKPYLLTSVTNNMGARTTIGYAPSTSFYLADRAAGTPWVTRLPFPVQCVERVELHDDVSGNTFVTRYRYHHGYYDAAEREFRGFGCVEQIDTESMAAFVGAGRFAGPAEAELYVPPALTKSWFDTGAFFESDTIEARYAAEFYAGDPDAARLPGSTTPAAVTAREAREARRALKGRLVRTEIYAQDGNEAPYAVSEHRYEARLVQPGADGQFAVFFAFERELLESHYERRVHDPRVTHALTLDVDDFGTVTRSAAIAYPRRQPVVDEQGATLATVTEAIVFNHAAQNGWYRLGVPLATSRFELTALPALSRPPYSIDAVRAAATNAAPISYEATPTGALERRLIAAERVLYYPDADSSAKAAALPFGTVESLALPYEKYQMAFTPGLVAQVYGNRVNDALLRDAGYVQPPNDQNWWVASGRQVFDAASFHLPVAVIDPFGQMTSATYDVHALLITATVDALGNAVRGELDYRVLQPVLVTDPNGNRRAASFDELGLVVGTAVMGKAAGPPEGDTLDDPTTLFDYDVHNWRSNGKPAYSHTRSRETHGTTNQRWVESYSYSDGVGREVMQKGKVAGGRWVGSGRTVYDNKGNPVKKYEPFFSATPDYESESALVQTGVTPVLRYDPLGRLVRTDQPNGTLSRVEHDAWHQQTWDANDTVNESLWYAERKVLDPSKDEEGRAAAITEPHAQTPTATDLDPLGRTVRGVSDAGGGTTFATRMALDIAGNALSVTDARGHVVMRQTFDMLGRPLHSESADAGAVWVLPSVTDNAVRSWDGSNTAVRRSFDALQRPTHVHVHPDGAAEVLAERVVYGESIAGAETANLRTREFQHFDGAGVTTAQVYDFKGNVLAGARRMATSHLAAADWTALETGLVPLLGGTHDAATVAAASDPWLETEHPFVTASAYDALGHATTHTQPDGSVLSYAFDDAGLLNTVTVALPGAVVTDYVTGITYDAKGRREQITYASGSGNVARTKYAYDPLTFRLQRLTTTRNGGDRLQDLVYTYDPVGNVTQIDDLAQQGVYFDNSFIAPSSLYEYDPLYRLTSATGREHAGQAAGQDQVFVPGLVAAPTDGQAMRTYTERYEYDGVGNILSVAHQWKTGSWTRRYDYENTSNRLRSTSVPGDVAAPYTAQYVYDALGNMTAMPHLKTITWDFANRMTAADRGGGGVVHFAYDASGERVRKTVVSSGGAKVEERVYVGGFERYRTFDGAGTTALERTSVHVMDDTQRIALVETQTIASGVKVQAPAPLVRYQFGNHLGSALVELDERARLISYEEYHPYGTTAYRAAPGAVEASPKRYRYTGKERDEETGLAYHSARYYAPWLGRWVSCDPAGFVDGPNLFVYGRDNPIGLRDAGGTRAHGGTAVPATKPDSCDGICVMEPEVIQGKGTPVALEILRYQIASPEEKERMTLQAARDYAFEAAGPRNAVLNEITRPHKFAFAERAITYTIEFAMQVILQEFVSIPFGGSAKPLVNVVEHEAPVAANVIETRVINQAGNTIVNQGEKVLVHEAEQTIVGQGVKGAANAGAAPIQRSVSGTLLQVRDEAVAIARKIVAEDLKQGVKTGPAQFGNYVDRIGKSLTEQLVKDGVLPSTIRTTRVGVGGPDIIDLATHEAWDFTTATVRQVAGHDLRYHGRTFMGVLIDARKLFPLVYTF